MGFGDDYNARASPWEKFLMSFTHILLLPCIALLWRSRNTHPVTIVSLVAVIMASTSYHLCYSYGLGLCLFERPEMHHAMDRHLSSLLSLVLTFTFAMPEEDPWWKGLVVAIVAAAHTLLEIGAGNILPLQMPVLISFIVTIFFGSLKVWTWLMSSDHSQSLSLAYKRVRWRYAFVLLILNLGANAFFYYNGPGEGTYHSFWHSLAFLVIALYLRNGPILTPAPHSPRKLNAQIRLFARSLDSRCVHGMKVSVLWMGK